MQDFKFRLDTDNADIYGGTLIGTTIGSQPDLRIAFHDGGFQNEIKNGMIKVYVEEYRVGVGNMYWLKIKGRLIVDLEADFVIQLNDKKASVNFDWITFYFRSDENGLYMKKVGQPNTYNAGNLSNTTLDRMVLQEGYVLNTFQMRVIQTLAKNNKLKERKKDKE